MAIQDRNVHRDAELLKKAANAVIADPANADEDEPIYVKQPRYNYRVSDLSAYARVIATADINLRAKAVQDNGVVGSPQFAVAAAVTFAIEALWQNLVGVLTRLAATAAQAFSGTEVVLDGTWGVWLVTIDSGQTIITIAPSGIMAFATEEDALRACPQVVGDGSEGVIGILTLEAVGGDFTAGTTNTNDGIVANFNTFDLGGLNAALVVGTDPQAANALLTGLTIKDPAGMRVLDGRGDTDLLVVSARSDGAAVSTEGTLQAEYRPSPVQGEGRGDLSVTQTRPQYTP